MDKLLQVQRSQPIGQFDQRRLIGCGLQTVGHPGAAVRVEHPGGNELASAGGLKFDVFNLARTESPQDREILFATERMKGIANSDNALIAGIIACRL